MLYTIYYTIVQEHVTWVGEILSNSRKYFIHQFKRNVNFAEIYIKCVGLEENLTQSDKNIKKVHRAKQQRQWLDSWQVPEEFFNQSLKPIFFI